MNIKHNLSYTRFYQTWTQIKVRCLVPSNSNFKHYGAKGITLCDRWMSFINFKDDMYESYLDHSEKYSEKNTTIDRIDVKTGYSKENCRWATRKLQGNNKSNTTFVNLHGKEISLKILAEQYGINYETLKHRIVKKKMPVEQAIYKKVR